MLKIAGMGRGRCGGVYRDGCTAAQACRGLERLGEAPDGGRERGRAMAVSLRD